MPTRYQIGCNNCGNGKPLFFKRYSPSMMGGPGFTYEPYTLIQSRVEVEQLEEGCPKCGCKDLEIIKVL